MYDGLKLLHVLGVVAFLGNVATGLGTEAQDPHALSRARKRRRTGFVSGWPTRSQ